MNLKTCLCAALGLGLAGAAAAETLPPKPARAVVCAACHGQNGVSTLPIYPNLAGQQESYIEHALHAYKNGERKNPIMAAQAAGLSDQDIKELAAWFAAQKPAVYVPDVNAPLTAQK
ncbi:MAG: cytochrome c [Sinobacteraceae bacterium]|nr:cytochrome c [Nevskia sp.]MDI3260639.1 cytochrome c [Nevskiaceae bacterium]